MRKVRKYSRIAHTSSCEYIPDYWWVPSTLEAEAEGSQVWGCWKQNETKRLQQMNSYHLLVTVRKPAVCRDSVVWIRLYLGPVCVFISRIPCWSALGRMTEALRGSAKPLLAFSFCVESWWHLQSHSHGQDHCSVMTGQVTTQIRWTKGCFGSWIGHNRMIWAFTTPLAHDLK